MNTPAFRPHGEAQIEVTDGVLTVHLRGDWNAEMRALTAQQMAPHAAALNAAGPWGLINVLHDTVVYSADIYAATRRSYASRAPDSQLRAVAFVLGPEVEGAALMRPRLETLLAGVISSQVFPDLPQAQAWIQAQVQLP